MFIAFAFICLVLVLSNADDNVVVIDSSIISTVTLFSSSAEVIRTFSFTIDENDENKIKTVNVIGLPHTLDDSSLQIKVFTEKKEKEDHSFFIPNIEILDNTISSVYIPTDKTKKYKEEADRLNSILKVYEEDLVKINLQYDRYMTKKESMSKYIDAILADKTLTRYYHHYNHQRHRYNPFYYYVKERKRLILLTSKKHSYKKQMSSWLILV